MGWSGNRVVNGLLVMWLTAKLIPWIEANPKNDITVMCIAIVIAIAVAVFAAFKSYPVDYDDAGKILVDGAKMARICFSLMYQTLEVIRSKRQYFFRTSKMSPGSTGLLKWSFIPAS